MTPLSSMSHLARNPHRANMASDGSLYDPLAQYRQNAPGLTGRDLDALTREHWAAGHAAGRQLAAERYADIWDEGHAAGAAAGRAELAELLGRDVAHRLRTLTARLAARVDEPKSTIAKERGFIVEMAAYAIETLKRLREALSEGEL